LVRAAPLAAAGMLGKPDWPMSPSSETLAQRWRSFVSIEDLNDRSVAFSTAKTGRKSIRKRQQRLADLGPETPAPPITRYGFRSFHRQWILEDVRLLKTEAPTLWSARSDRQILMMTLATGALGSGLGRACSRACRTITPSADGWQGRHSASSRCCRDAGRQSRAFAGGWVFARSGGRLGARRPVCLLLRHSGWK
jgi:hypothetical protein